MPSSAGRAGRRLIGLTGNIACGKSTVLAELAALGAETIDADRLIHQLYVAGSPITAAIAAAFGPGVLAADGSVDRRALGQIVFAEPVRLRQLEGITHPAVRQLIDQRLAASRAAVVVIDAIKLIEGGLADRCDSVWVVTCPPAQQLARLMARNQLTRSEAEQRIAAQPPVAAKRARADVIIDNGGSREATRAQVERAWFQLTRPDCIRSK
jgi:dephospho-CoA kinase